jgi:hypothetical protein
MNRQTYSKSLLILVLFLAVLLPACNQQPVADIEEEIKTAEDFSAWIEALSKRPPNYTPPKITFSSALILQDYNSGMLSEEEYYLLNITAAYHYDQLPREYRDGAEPDQAPDASWLLWEIRQKIETFSPETQALLQPYLLSCDDPASFWYDPLLPAWALPNPLTGSGSP